MRFDLCLRLSRERGRCAPRSATRLPNRRALLRGVAAATWLAGAQGAVALAPSGAAPSTPAKAPAADLFDVPFFNSARTVWGGLLASTAVPRIVPAPDAAGVRTDDRPGASIVRAGACAPYVVLCDAAHGAIERDYTGRFGYRFASTLPQVGVPVAFASRDAGLVSAEPFKLAEPVAGTRVGAITGSLRASLARADLPAGVAAQVMRALAGRLDPKLKGAVGDTFRVAFEPAGDASLSGAVRVTAFDIRLRGQRVAAVWFAADARSPGAYYDLDGVPLAGTRFALPVSAKRTSSRFGTRVHPVTGARHVHTGVDLAAPTGRTVRASERGVVSYIGTQPGGYGKYVVVRHGGGYASYYAHLSAFEPTLRTGMRIARGQRVGAVGSTGTATGPHLHFEVRRHNRPVDPVVLVRAAKADALKGQQRVAFQRVATGARTQLASVAWSQPVAMKRAGTSEAG
ncbi:M23 family metallopeptidase [Burkholderia sp. IMCC1007]|uniref:M23 family metallopeptidase n=1 Tax=Burkholderia sp. IMCC1007 TaxID=3004104 RepID=UPI0022B37EC4|nr:M23 family metallopeptidase [Burkholderia sp. IMCC1007]